MSVSTDAGRITISSWTLAIIIVASGLVGMITHSVFASEPRPDYECPPGYSEAGGGSPTHNQFWCESLDDSHRIPIYIRVAPGPELTRP